MNIKKSKKIKDKSNPGLYNRSYQQDPSSHESRWSNRIFRDQKTNAIIIPPSILNATISWMDLKWILQSC